MLGVAITPSARASGMSSATLTTKTDLGRRGARNLGPQAQTGLEEARANVNWRRPPGYLEHCSQPSGVVVVSVAHHDRIELGELIGQPEHLGVADQSLGRPRVEEDTTPVGQDQQRQSVLAYQIGGAVGLIFGKDDDLHGCILRHRGPPDAAARTRSSRS